MTDIIADPPIKLPVFQTARRSFTFMIESWRLVALPFVALFLGDLLIQHFVIHHLVHAAAARFGANLLLFMFQASFIVGVHRTILLNEERPGITFYRLDIYWLRFLLTWLGFTAIFLAIAGTFGVLAGLTWYLVPGIMADGQVRLEGIGVLTALALAAIILGLYFMVRLSLSLPASAVGEAGSLRLSWRLTRSNFWRLFALNMVVSLPVIALLLPNMIYYSYLAVEAARLHVSTTSLPLPVPVEIWTSFIGAIGIVIYAASLSLSYGILAPGSARRSWTA